MKLRLLIVLAVAVLVAGCELIPQDQETQDKIQHSFECMWLGGC